MNSLSTNLNWVVPSDEVLAVIQITFRLIHLVCTSSQAVIALFRQLSKGLRSGEKRRELHTKRQRPNSPDEL